MIFSPRNGRNQRRFCKVPTGQFELVAGRDNFCDNQVSGNLSQKYLQWFYPLNQRRVEISPLLSPTALLESKTVFIGTIYGFVRFGNVCAQLIRTFFDAFISFLQLSGFLRSSR